MKRIRSIICAAILLVCGVALPAQARQAGRFTRRGVPRAATPIDEFLRMSPEDRRKALDQLPPAKRRRLEERIQRFNQLPAPEQQNLRGMYDRLNELPAERQTAVRGSLREFAAQPADRKKAMRQALRSMASLPEAEREARMSSPEICSRFSQQEQGILRSMSQLLPPK